MFDMCNNFEYEHDKPIKPLNHTSRLNNLCLIKVIDDIVNIVPRSFDFLLDVLLSIVKAIDLISDLLELVLKLLDVRLNEAKLAVNFLLVGLVLDHEVVALDPPFCLSFAYVIAED